MLYRQCKNKTVLFWSGERTELFTTDLHFGVILGIWIGALSACFIVKKPVQFKKNRISSVLIFVNDNTIKTDNTAAADGCAQSESFCWEELQIFFTVICGLTSFVMLCIKGSLSTLADFTNCSYFCRIKLPTPETTQNTNIFCTMSSSSFFSMAAYTHNTHLLSD